VFFNGKAVAAILKGKSFPFRLSSYSPHEREEYAFIPLRESGSPAERPLGKEKAESRPGGLRMNISSSHVWRTLQRNEAMKFLHREIRWYHGVAPSFEDGRLLLY